MITRIAEIAAMIGFFLVFAAIPASADPTTTETATVQEPMIKCKNNSHVWRPEQCDRPAPFTIGGGGSGDRQGGILGVIEGIVGRIL